VELHLTTESKHLKAILHVRQKGRSSQSFFCQNAQCYTHFLLIRCPEYGDIGRSSFLCCNIDNLNGQTMTKLALLTYEVDLELGVCPVVQDYYYSLFSNDHTLLSNRIKFD
jgi:hypothetical protein